MSFANSICLFVLFQFSHAIKIELTNGVIEGTRVSVGSKTVNIFKNIPLAEPPLGKLRFQKLQPKKPWTGVLDATKYAKACISNTSFTTSPEKNVSENCMYTNVFADERCMQKACPIMFFIHGGNFYYGSAVAFNDTEIINKYASDEIIVVIPAYRVGLFGFLDVGHEFEDAPYNIGMYDMIFALHWLQQEGSKFGGDIRRITAVGNSDGATAILLLMATPLLKAGDFDKVVVISVTMKLSPHANLKVTNMVSGILNCTKDKNGIKLEASQQLKCLRNAPAKSISNAARQTEELWFYNGPQSDNVVFPAIDYNELMQKFFKPAQMLITVTEEEMMLRRRGRDDANMCLAHFSTFGFRSNKTIDACVQFYTQNNMSEIVRDVVYATSMKIAVKNRLQNDKTYFGVFAQVNHSKHANDLDYLIGLHKIVNATENDNAMNDYYPQMLKQFIKTGVPDPKWPPINEHGENYFVLKFDKDNKITPYCVEGEIYERDRIKIWLEDFEEVERNATKMISLFVSNQTFDNSDASESSRSILLLLSSLAVLLAIMILIAAVKCFLFGRHRRYKDVKFNENTRILNNDVQRYV